jgi:hypothetical protein
MASHFLGDSAISAIGSTAAFISFISSVFWGYAAGFSVYVAVLFGRGDYPKMLNVIKLNIFFSSLVVLGTAVLCLVFHEQIFDFLNIEYSFVNDGSSQLVISRLVSTCSCAVATYDKRVINPGERGVIRLVYNPKGRVGTNLQRVFVYTDENRQPTAILRLEVTTSF